MEEVLYWYWTRSALRPSDFIFYINFKYVALKRKATYEEEDRLNLVYLGQKTRLDIEREIGINYSEKYNKAN